MNGKLLVLLALSAIAPVAAAGAHGSGRAERRVRLVAGETSVQDLLFLAAEAPAPVAERARALLEDVADAEKVAPLLALLGSGSGRSRLLAARALARIGDARSTAALLYAGLADDSGRVREAALDGAASMDACRVTRTLVHLFEARGGASGRGYIQIGSQEAFVQDYDTEVS